MHSEIVAAIMPTADRQAFVDRAVKMFLAQDYPNTQLVVVDDGNTKTTVPEADNIRLIRLSSRMSIGAKRNIACAAADAPIICHWDDDDIYEPTRISSQLAQLIPGVDVVAYDSMEFLRESTGERFRYTGRPVGVSLMYRRTYWQTHPFRDIAVGEDGAFASTAESERKLKVLPCDGQIVATIHSANTSPRDLSRKEWTRCA